KFSESDALRAVTQRFQVVQPGSAEVSGTSSPATPKNVPNRGGEANPSASALQQKFGGAIKRVDVVWGETTVFVDGASALEVMTWLKNDPSQQYDYLSDVTAVEYREADTPIEVVWHLRSLPFRRFL